MIHTKSKCLVCGDVIQEGRKDFFCRFYAFGRSCSFHISKKQNAITKMSGRTLDIQTFLKLLQPAGLTVPIQDKRYQFQIITNKKREWEITIRTSIVSEINARRREDCDEVIKNLELSESRN